MKLLDKLEPLLLLLAVAAGLALERSAPASFLARAFVGPFLTFMLLGLFWEIPVKDIRAAFGNVRFALSSVFVNFVWTPAFAWLLTRTFMESAPLMGLGFILLLVTPCTDWYLVFTGMAKGNVKLSVSILPTNLILQIFLLPLYILLLSGNKVDVDMFSLGKSLALALIVPFVLDKALKRLFSNMAGPTSMMEKLFAKRQFVWLWLAILAMFASENIFGAGYPKIFAMIIVPIVIFFVVTIFFGQAVSKAMGFSREDGVSLRFTTLARNSPLALAFAQRAFPGQGEVLLPLIIGPLVELPLLALIAWLTL
ncbi:MAG: bile acid:sodium symporter, partial [Deltaproteobacteria bacterium]|nr:bile acid:sodium symporter [Deltaproteobacteria bacterium]